ncbi:MAG: dGTPase [Robiginitomaculum sp.]|nr:MAG: dGTPase [Robiginitomaculum sp.]
MNINETMKVRRLRQDQRVDDVRSEYDRDEARLIHSAAFRRLQSKTQVLGLGESDFYRTRLTHSMEVAQIGRGIVQYLSSHCDEKYKEHLPCVALISAICLAHDIGHPPFGHGGEVALNYCMRKYGGFEGNGQTLRILGKLDKYTDEHGLNPTRRMLLGVLKYPVSYNNLVNDKVYKISKDENLPYWLFEAHSQKPPKCFHDDDQAIFDFIMEEFSDKDIQNFTKIKTEEIEHKEEEEEIEHKHKKSCFKSLDCTIMNLADNISYSLHDLEDALSLGMITKLDWEQHFEGKECLFNDVASNREDLEYEAIRDALFGLSHERKNAIGALVNVMVTSSDIYENGSGCGHPLLKLEVKLTPSVEILREEIFNIVLDKVIRDENVQHLEFKGQKLIIELFQALSTDPERFLPKPTLERWKKAANNLVKEEKKQAQMRVVCDFVSGMTDSYATKFYDKLFTPSKGSIFDRL